MKVFWIILHLVRADFLERTRRYSFLITLGLAIFAAHGFLPASDARYVAIDLGGYRGLYTSAWVGSSMALITSLYLFLAGFYLVKNAIERDVQTGVGQIIATTPLPKSVYLLGKAISNFAVLALIVGLVLVSAGVVQLLRGEDLQLDLGALVIPFVVITLPAMAVTAALAILFETLPSLRGGLGNVAYVFVWMFVSAGSAGLTLGANFPAAAVDPMGTLIPVSSMLSAARALPDQDGDLNIGPYPLEGDPLKTFRWEGMSWTADILLIRLAWIGLAVGIVLLAATFFDRFASSREMAGGKSEPRKPKGTRKSAQGVEGLSSRSDHLGVLPAGARRFSFLQTLLAELRLLLKGQRWWWYTGAAIMIIGGLVSPVDTVRQAWLPAAWIWPILIWSSLGNREERHRTGQLVFSAPHPVLRQLPAAWLSGSAVSMLAGSGAALTLLRSGDWAALGAWLAGAMFIPSLALALGTWSGSSKLFEVMYVIWWYLGPLHPLKVPQLDFMGAGNTAIALGMPLFYLALAVLLLGLTGVGRRRQVKA